MRRPLLALALAAAALVAAPASAQDSPSQPLAGAPLPTDGRQVTSQITTWTGALDKLETALAVTGISDEDLTAARSQLEKIRNDAKALSDAATSSVNDKRQLLDALGPPPADDTVKEAPELARQRASLNADIADYDGRAKRAQVITARAEALMTIATETARQRIAAKVMAKETSPFSLQLWRDGIPQAAEALAALAAAPALWWQTEGTPEKVAKAWPTVLLVSVVATILGWPIRRWLLRRGGPRSDIEAPTYGRRVLAASAAGLASSAIPVLALVSVYVSLEAHGLLFGDLETILRGFVVGLSIFFVIGGFAHVALQPHLPAWRVARLTEDSADRLDSRLQLLAVMLGINGFVWIAFHIPDADDAFRALVNLFANSTVAFGLWPLLGDRAWLRDETPAEGEEEESDARDPRLYVVARRLIRLLVLAIPIAALAGYYNLSDYITRNIILAGALFGVFSALSTVVGEMTWAMIGAQQGALRQVRKAIGLSEDSGRIAQFWIAGFFNVVLAIVLFLVFLPSAGVPEEDIADFLRTGISGLKIGNFTISLTDIFLGIAVFILALRLTRMVQRLLEKRILPQTRFDPGVQNSIKSAAGYAGATIGVVIAVSVAGINFSNIAIIAGALSVGIGFGLQNIVNNFISGLIVLVERPVKVGDWVVIGGAEGTVKRINVRATEIETFKRATVIVPNGELISQSIVNYTLRNKLGRIDIPVGVAYGTEPLEVEKVLLELAAGHKAVLSFPKPRVLFQSFGASSLDFELRCFIANIEDGLTVRTELMYAIESAFRERNIEIPFQQSEVNFKTRDLEKLEAILQRILDTRHHDEKKEPEA
ncbi:mechanosensitive ion channel domain-containing protein [Zavarzinia sp.]|uniref:mechanosensitive ion channel domain-containing protein n=1 Tax=Zavarzinia sp. TaxID=2027920 RepID=UPI00356402F4